MGRETLKILCCCAGGNVRSRAAAHYLTSKYGHDTLSMGLDCSHAGTQEMLFQWADRIVIMTKHMLDKIPEPHRPKVSICEVGRDDYGSPWHFILMHKVMEFSHDWDRKGFA